jgi:hypothetical protein
MTIAAPRDAAMNVLLGLAFVLPKIQESFRRRSISHGQGVLGGEDAWAP